MSETCGDLRKMIEQARKLANSQSEKYFSTEPSDNPEECFLSLHDCLIINILHCKYIAELLVINKFNVELTKEWVRATHNLVACCIDVEMMAEGFSSKIKNKGTNAKLN